MGGSEPAADEEPGDQRTQGGPGFAWHPHGVKGLALDPADAERRQSIPCGDGTDGKMGS